MGSLAKQPGTRHPTPGTSNTKMLYDCIALALHAWATVDGTTMQWQRVDCIHRLRYRIYLDAFSTNASCKFVVTFTSLAVEAVSQIIRNKIIPSNDWFCAPYHVRIDYFNEYLTI
jgi:hypothetical protein